MKKVDKNTEIEQDNVQEGNIPQQENATAQDIEGTAQLETQLAEQKEKYIRLMAEFENYKKRTSAEKLDMIQTAGKDILVAMLEVLDDMDRAEKQMEQDNDVHHVVEGVQLVFNKFRNLMTAKGVKPVESIGQDFDTELHEAIANVPAPSPDLAGKVIDEVQKGYTLNDKLVRFPKVVVGS